MYTQSHGLESFVQERLVTDGETLAALLGNYLVNQVGPADGVALSCAHAAATAGDLPRIAIVDQRLSAVKLARESREASRKTGRRVLSLAARLFDDALLRAYRDQVEADRTLGNYAVVLGVITATLGIPREQAMAMELYSFAVSFLGAGMRLSLVNHEEIQAILHRLKPLLDQVVQQNLGKGPEEISASLPQADIMGMIHERAEVRLFIS